jgi:predicted nucleic acid-binding protein
VKAAVVDASVWVSRLVPADAHHAAVARFLERARKEETALLSPAMLLPEVAGAVGRRTGDPRLARRAAAALSDLPGLTIVALDAPLVRLAARLAGDHGLRGADAFYVAVASRLGVPLVTLDREQRDRAARCVEVAAP